MLKIPRGRHTYGPEPEILGVASIAKGSSIGCFCSVAKGLQFLMRGSHMLNWVSTYPFQAMWKSNVLLHNLPDTSPIIIGNDVWVATNVKIKQGVSVGDGAVLAEESFITKDVPPYAIVGGVPAKIIRFRFSEARIKELLTICWWNWDDSKIKKCVHLIASDEIDNFISWAKSYKE